MNNLSWFIYLTQIADNLVGAAAETLVVAGIFGGLSLGMFYAYTISEIYMSSTNDDEKYLLGLRRKLTKWFIGIMASAAIITTFTPTRQTMLMIAGSEMGERLVKSDCVNSIVNPGMDLIRKWIKQEADKIKDKS